MNQTGDGYLIISDENLIMATAAEQQHMQPEKAGIGQDD